MSLLKDRLLAIEDDFLTALIEGGDALSSFNDRWETMVLEMDHALESNILESDVAMLAHTVASRCATLAETSADLLFRNDSLTSELVGELDCLMSELTISDLAPPPSFNHKHGEPEREPHVIGTICGRKRPRSLEDRIPSHSLSRSQKKIRVQSEEAVCSTTHHPRTPPASSTSRPHSPTTLPSADSRESASLTMSRQSRKRRISDTDLVTTPVGVKRLHRGPRLHAVSDSFTASPTPVVQKESTEATIALSNGPLPAAEALIDLHQPHCHWSSGSPASPLNVPTMVEVSGDLAGSSFWPNTVEGSMLPELAGFDDFLQTLLEPESIALALPVPPSPTTSCHSIQSRDSSSSPSYPSTPLPDSEINLRPSWYQYNHTLVYNFDSSPGTTFTIDVPLDGFASHNLSQGLQTLAPIFPDGGFECPFNQSNPCWLISSPPPLKSCDFNLHALLSSV